MLIFALLTAAPSHHSSAQASEYIPDTLAARLLAASFVLNSISGTSTYWHTFPCRHSLDLILRNTHMEV